MSLFYKGLDAPYFFVYSCFTAFAVLLEIVMFTVDQVTMLDEALDSHEAVLRRRINAEKNESIKSILGAEARKLDEIRVIVNNPKMVSK